MVIHHLLMLELSEHESAEFVQFVNLNNRSISHFLSRLKWDQD